MLSDFFDLFCDSGLQRTCRDDEGGQAGSGSFVGAWLGASSGAFVAGCTDFGLVARQGMTGGRTGFDVGRARGSTPC